MIDITNSDLLDTAVKIARAAGEILRQGFGTVEVYEHKGAIDLVTEYDRRSEELILGELHRAFPDHGLIGEESTTGTVDLLAAEPDCPTWLVDPLDGTTNYAHGFPIFCVSMALWQGSKPILGLVYDPLREECFTAVTGSGCRLNGREVQVSATADLSSALLATGFPYDIRTSPPEGTNLAQFEAFARRAQAIRRAGSAALDLAYVACGRFDGFWEMKLHPWDIAAGIILIQEAGGAVSDFDGRLAVPQSAARIVGTNGRIHEQMLAVLR